MRDLSSGILPIECSRCPGLRWLGLPGCLFRRLPEPFDEDRGKFSGPCPAYARLESCRELLSCGAFFLPPRIVASENRSFAQSCAAAIDEADRAMSFEVGFTGSPDD